jgi:hypothetical protein
MAIREQVSGPGRLAKRTDRNVSKQPTRYIGGGAYGEGQENLALQQGAPMSAGIDAASASPAVAFSRSLMEPLTPINAPTNRPDEPYTAGLDTGPGPDSMALDMPMQQRPMLENVLQELMRYDETGEVAEIYNFVVDKGIY